MSDTGPGSRVGTQFGPYHLKRLLGRGGMGEVYEAEDTVKDRVVALKLMSATFSQDPVFRKRMQREAHTAGRLQEPHVVPIHDYGEIDGQLYLDMRLIEGNDLSALLKRFGPLTPVRAVAIVRQVAAALDAAHAAGVMHRDVKPENVLITRDDFAYLVDFGIASATTDERLTQLGSAVGTWKYMAPERFSNDEVTYRADIYALACVLCECLTGSPPYRADSASVLVTAHLMDPIPRPSQVRPGIPAALDDVIARGMAKRPEDRYASAGDLTMAAHQALSSPDQDQAATLLRRSQEAVLPGAASTVTFPTAAQTPSPSWNPPSSTPTPTPAPAPTWNQPTPTPTPAPTPTWNQPTPTPPPISAPTPMWNPPSSTPTPTPAPTPTWNQPTPTPPPMSAPTPTWDQPQLQAQPKGSSPIKWILLAGAAVVVLVTIVIVAVLVLTPSPPKPPPTLTADQMDSLLLNAPEVNTLMGASNMQGGKPGDQPGNPTFTLSNQDCLGALYSGEGPTYEDSGYDKLHYLTLSEPGTSNDHFVDEDVALFPSADKAKAFVQSQATAWSGCATQTVTVTGRDNTTSTWHIGPLDGAPPKISQMDTQRNTSGWKCQRALSAMSNVVLDVNACGYNVSDEAVRIADKMAGKMPK